MAAEVLAQRLDGLANVNDSYQMRIALNAMIDGIRAVLTILDADAGVTATTTLATFDAAITK